LPILVLFLLVACQRSFEGQSHDLAGSTSLYLGLLFVAGLLVRRWQFESAMANHGVIPSTDWAAYRPVFEDGGCAIPANGNDFLDALARINLLETPGPDERVAGWCELQFKTEEIIRQVRDARDERAR
jgi:hypothetical protein